MEAPVVAAVTPVAKPIQAVVRTIFQVAIEFDANCASCCRPGIACAHESGSFSCTSQAASRAWRPLLILFKLVGMKTAPSEPTAVPAPNNIQPVRRQGYEVVASARLGSEAAEAPFSLSCFESVVAGATRALGRCGAPGKR